MVARLRAGEEAREAERLRENIVRSENWLTYALIALPAGAEQQLARGHGRGGCRQLRGGRAGGARAGARAVLGGQRRGGPVPAPAARLRGLPGRGVEDLHSAGASSNSSDCYTNIHLYPSFKGFNHRGGITFEGLIKDAVHKNDC